MTSGRYRRAHFRRVVGRALQALQAGGVPEGWKRSAEDFRKAIEELRRKVYVRVARGATPAMFAVEAAA